jgi:YggT family protein
MLTQIANYLLHTLITLYLGCLLLRLLLQWCRADFYNPISQFVIKATHPLVGPVRRVIPAIGRVDTATLLLLIGLEVVAIALLCLINYGALPLPSIALWAPIGIASLLVHFYFLLLIVMIVLSWVAPFSRHPAALLVWQLCEPVMAPLRKVIPPLGGLDISPIFLFIGINVLTIVLNHAAAAVGLVPLLVPGFY